MLLLILILWQQVTLSVCGWCLIPSCQILLLFDQDCNVEMPFSLLMMSVFKIWRYQRLWHFCNKYVLSLPPPPPPSLSLSLSLSLSPSPSLSLLIIYSLSLALQCIPQQQVTLKIQREQQSAPRPPITPQGTPIMSHVKVQNGYKDEPETNPSLLKVARLNSLDLQRVHSDALPKHMVASKVYTSVEGSYKELASNDIAELLPDNVATEMTGSSVDTDSHHTLSSAGGIDSVSHLEASHSQEESLLQEIANAKDFSFSNDYFSQGHYHSSPQRDSPSPTSPQIMRSGSGKSQSSSQLSTVSPILVGHRRTNTYSHTYYPQEKSRSQAKKTESLPIFKSHTLDKKHCHSDSSGSGMGLNLTNLSLEDVHSASKLQIDQIWQEVEKSTTGMDSPTTEDVPTAIDPTAIQIPNNNWSNEMEVDLSSSSSPYHQGYGRRDEKDVEDSIGTRLVLVYMYVHVHVVSIKMKYMYL